MSKILLTPVLIAGWLEGMHGVVAQAARDNLYAEVEGEIEGALAVNREGKAMLLLKLQADLAPEAMEALLGGLPANVDGVLEVGWSQDTKVGRLAWGKCRAKFSTRESTSTHAVGFLAPALPEES
jgi:hypothetical protein